MRISGFESSRLLSTSTAPGVDLTIASTFSAICSSLERSSPRILSVTGFSPPPPPTPTPPGPSSHINTISYYGPLFHGLLFPRLLAASF